MYLFVRFGELLGERLLAVVDVDDGGLEGFAHLGEQVHEHLEAVFALVLADKVGGREVEQGGARLVGNDMCEHLLAATARPGDQYGLDERRVLVHNLRTEREYAVQSGQVAHVGERGHGLDTCLAQRGAQEAVLALEVAQLAALGLDDDALLDELAEELGDRAIGREVLLLLLLLALLLLAALLLLLLVLGLVDGRLQVLQLLAHQLVHLQTHHLLDLESLLLLDYLGVVGLIQLRVFALSPNTFLFRF